MNTKPVVAFVSVPSVNYDQIFDLGALPPFLSMPLGLMYLSSSVKKTKSASNVFHIDYLVAASKLHNEVEASNKDLIKKYKNKPNLFFIDTALAAANNLIPDVIGVSMNFTTQGPIAKLIIEELKKLWPNSKVVIGGNYATNNVPILLSHPDVDYICRGEAELSFPLFLNAISEKKNLNIKGFYSKKDVADKNAISANCDYSQNIDELPFPDWDLLDCDAYQLGKAKRKREFLTESDSKNFSIFTSRGCPYHCTFCASYTVHGRKMRFRSTENVVEEMKKIYQNFGATVFVPEDDLFTVNKSRTMHLLKGIKEAGIPNLEMQFPSALSVNTLDEEVIDSMCEAGMNIFYLAIESGSPYTQVNIIKKRVNLDRAKRLVKYANKRKLYTRCNFIIGFPNEKREHVQETIDYIKTLSADWYAIFVATPLVGTEMFEQFANQGVLDHSSRDWETNFQGRHFDTEHFKAEEILEIAYRTNLEVNFVENRQMRLGDWKLALEVFNDVLNLHPYHVIAHYMSMMCLENLGKHKEANDRLNKIKHLVQTVDTSSEMLKKYGDLVPNLLDLLGWKDSKLTNKLQNKNANSKQNPFLYSQSFNTGSDMLKFGANAAIAKNKVIAGVQPFESKGRRGGNDE